MRRATRKKQRISGGEEIEIKLRVAGRRSALRQLARLGARAEKGRVHEMNTLYDTRNGVLARNGQLLRIRVERRAGRAADRPKPAGRAARNDPIALLTYKGPQRGQEARGRQGRQYKVREEREVRVGNPEGLAGVLEAIGLRPWFRYEKYRSSYHLPGLAGLKVDLDETPIGNYLELEGSREAIDRAAARLGYGPTEYIVVSYGALYRAWCGKGPARDPGREPVPWAGLEDMLFGRRK